MFSLSLQPQCRTLSLSKEEVFIHRSKIETEGQWYYHFTISSLLKYMKHGRLLVACFVVFAIIFDAQPPSVCCDIQP